MNKNISSIILSQQLICVYYKIELCILVLRLQNFSIKLESTTYE